MNISGCFNDCRSFVIWKEFPPDIPGDKNKKVPISHLTGQKIDYLNPTNWIDYSTAVNYAASGFEIGIILTADNNKNCVDIDNCLMPDGTWSVLALTILSLLPGCYVEISFNGKGLHIFFNGDVPDHVKKNTSLDMEFYTEKRFMALTGWNSYGDSRTVPPPETINYLVDSYFQPKEVNMMDWTDKPCEGWLGSADDDKLIEKMIKNNLNNPSVVLGSRCSINDLWNANEERLAHFYPHETKAWDFSSADAALCNHLAFWTGKDCARVERLFGMSGLVRDKWTDREKYRVDTIINAASGCTHEFKKAAPTQPGATPPGSTEAPGDPSLIMPGASENTIRSGFQFLDTNQQIDYFKGLVYIKKFNRVWSPKGDLMNSQTFKAWYGGYVFSMDADQEKTTKNAWEAFTENQGYHFPKVDEVWFDPAIPTGEIFVREKKTVVNTYVDIQIESKPGDVSRFTDHLHAMFPVQGDYDIIINYLAAMVQYKGTKFQYCPVIQGVEGNGKSLITRVMTYAMGRTYTHCPNAQELAKGAGFNGYMMNKLLIIIEELHVNGRREVQEQFKQWITDDYIQIHQKGLDQIMAVNLFNMIINSNYKDSVMKTKGDRRFAVFYCAQQCVQDMIDLGWMKNEVENTDYFPNLYNWLKQEGGYAQVTYFLENFKIEEKLNPATLCVRAPVTSAFAEVINISRGGVEQEILEAVCQERQGFAGGFISSMAVDKLIEHRRNGGHITLNKRKEMLHELGYIYHPVLTNGRVNNFIHIDGGKPRLYIKKGHILGNIGKPSEVVKKYVELQMTQVPAGFQQQGEVAK